MLCHCPESLSLCFVSEATLLEQKLDLFRESHLLSTISHAVEAAIDKVQVFSQSYMSPISIMLDFVMTSATASKTT